MEVDNHVAFSKERHPALWHYILENNIKADHRDEEDIAAIDMYSSDPHWEWIGKYVKEKNVHCLRDLVYSRTELREAQWMSVRTTWRYGYPEPSAGYKFEDITYDKTNYCTICGVGLKQKDLFRLKKSPNWGRRHFFAPFWIEDELFMSETAKSVLHNAGITGVSFREVRNKKGSGQLPETWQLYIQHNTNPGLVLDKSYVAAVNTCPSCGRIKYGTTRENGSMQKFKKEALDYVPDVVKTYEVFGGMPLVAAQEILINQKAYRAIADNKLDRGLMFYPIELI